MGISGAIELTTEEEIQRQMNTNFTGAVRMCAAVLPFMREAGHGRIINISSIAGVLAVPFQAFYSASKFAIEGYSEALYQEVKPPDWFHSAAASEPDFPLPCAIWGEFCKSHAKCRVV